MNENTESSTIHLTLSRNIIDGLKMQKKAFDKTWNELFSMYLDGFYQEAKDEIEKHLELIKPSC